MSSTSNDKKEFNNYSSQQNGSPNIQSQLKVRDPHQNEKKSIKPPQPIMYGTSQNLPHYYNIYQPGALNHNSDSMINPAYPFNPLLPYPYQSSNYYNMSSTIIPNESKSSISRPNPMPIVPPPYPQYVLPTSQAQNGTVPQASYYPYPFYTDQPLPFAPPYNIIQNQMQPNHPQWTKIFNSKGYSVTSGFMPQAPQNLSIQPNVSTVQNPESYYKHNNANKLNEIHKQNEQKNSKHWTEGMEMHSFENLSHSNEGNSKPKLGSVLLYKKISQIGEGTYGKVYKAINQRDKGYVALKALRLEKEKDGFPITALREIKLLQNLKNDHIVQLIEMFTDQNSVYMVFEYLDYDLSGFVAHPSVKLNESHICHLTRQLLEGLEFLHKKNIAHRDLKGSNLLLNKQGQLKIADFGLARILNQKSNMDYTNRVITLWYRPPELLLGSTDYSTEIDMWGAGCIMVELFSEKALFPGKDEIDQLDKIYSMMGTPTLNDWPELNELPWYELIKSNICYEPRFIKTYESILSKEALNLAENLLKMDPKKRFSATDALKHDFFKRDLGDCIFDFPGLDGDWHEFEYKAWKKHGSSGITNKQIDINKVDATNGILEEQTLIDKKDNFRHELKFENNKIISSNSIDTSETSALVNKENDAENPIQSSNNFINKETLVTSGCVKEGIKNESSIYSENQKLLNSKDVSTNTSSGSTPKLPSRNPPTPPPPPPPAIDYLHSFDICPPLPPENCPPPPPNAPIVSNLDKQAVSSNSCSLHSSPKDKYNESDDFKLLNSTQISNSLKENLSKNLKVNDGLVLSTNKLPNEPFAANLSITNITISKADEIDTSQPGRFFPVSFTRNLRNRSPNISPKSDSHSSDSVLNIKSNDKEKSASISPNECSSPTRLKRISNHYSPNRDRRQLYSSDYLRSRSVTHNEHSRFSPSSRPRYEYESRYSSRLPPRRSETSSRSYSSRHQSHFDEYSESYRRYREYREDYDYRTYEYTRSTHSRGHDYHSSTHSGARSSYHSSHLDSRASRSATLYSSSREPNHEIDSIRDRDRDRELRETSNIRDRELGSIRNKELREIRDYRDTTDPEIPSSSLRDYDRGHLPRDHENYYRSSRDETDHPYYSSRHSTRSSRRY